MRLKSGIAALVFCVSTAALATPKRPPDVILILADDLNTHLGCYGYPTAKTPHIDALAASGMRFDRAYCQTPLCNPSRTSFLTGLRPETTGVFNNEIDWREKLKGVATLPEQFRAAGYETVGIGKIFHNTFEVPERWDRWIRPAENLPRPPERKPLKTPANFSSRKPGEKKGLLEWGPSGRGDREDLDGMKAEQAVRVLSAPRGEKPLFLAVGFSLPHLPFTAPERYFAMHPPERAILPFFPPGDCDDIPPPALMHPEIHGALTQQEWRELLSAYNACISYVDAGVGRILEALGKSGRADHTLVVFAGDHGFLLGEHGQWQKLRLFEETCRVPLILRAPGRVKRGSQTTALVELVDLFPTLIDLCGLPPVNTLEGTSVAPLLIDPERPWKKAAFSSINRAGGVSLRTPRYRYTEWTIGKEKAAELYDHENDPGEITNLAGDPAWAQTVQELRVLLTAGWQGALPAGAVR